MTYKDVVRRTGVRVGFCAVPYLLVASTLAWYGDERLIRSFWFAWCVLVIPLMGLMIDYIRLTTQNRQTRSDV